MSTALISGQVIVGVNNAGARVVTSARLTEPARRLRSRLPGCRPIRPTGNDVVLSVAVNAPSDSATRFSNGSKLPIVQ